MNKLSIYLYLSSLKCHPSLRPTPKQLPRRESASLALSSVGGWSEETGGISSCGDFKGFTRLASFSRPRPRKSQMEALLVGSFDVIKLYDCWRNEDSAVDYCCSVITGLAEGMEGVIFLFRWLQRLWFSTVMVEVFCGILSDADLASAFINELIFFPCFFVRVLAMICFVYLGTMLCCFKSQHFCCWIQRPNAVSHGPFAKPPTGKCLVEYVTCKIIQRY